MDFLRPLRVVFGGLSEVVGASLMEDLLGLIFRGFGDLSLGLKQIVEILNWVREFKAKDCNFF